MCRYDNEERLVDATQMLVSFWDQGRAACSVCGSPPEHQRPAFVAAKYNATLKTHDVQSSAGALSLRSTDTQNSRRSGVGTLHRRSVPQGASDGEDNVPNAVMPFLRRPQYTTYPLLARSDWKAGSVRGDRILGPRLWNILVASRGFLENGPTRNPNGPGHLGCLAPKARLFRGCRVAPVVGCAV